MIIPVAQSRDIFSASLRAVPDLWSVAETNPDAVTARLGQSQYAITLAGNGQAAIQKIIAGMDETIGWSPWEASSVLDLVSIPTAHLVSGEALRALLPPIQELISLSWNELKKAISLVAEKVLWPLLDLFTVIPVAGWVIDIVLGWIDSIVTLVNLAKESERAQRAETAVRPARPSSGADEYNTAAILDRSRLGDWTSLWMPAADPVDSDDDWRRGWGCELIAHDYNSRGKVVHSTYGGGRLIGPLSGNAWTFSRNDLRGTAAFSQPPPIVTTYGPYAFGGVPGSNLIHRSIQIADGAPDRLTIDTGSWLRLSTGALGQCWSSVLSSGPSTWAVDTRLALTAWERYAGAFLEQLDRGELCSQITQASRTAVRKFFLSNVLGVDENASTETALERMELRAALNYLYRRQAALAGTTAIAYCNARTCPPGLRESIERRQADLLTSPEVCRLDVKLITDPIYRAKVELAVMNRGEQCYTDESLQAPLDGPERWDTSAPTIPPPPMAAVPRPPRAAIPPARANRPPPRATTPKKRSSSKGGALAAGAVGLGALALLLRK